MTIAPEVRDPLPVVGVAEIAVILGVERRRVYDLTLSRDWPEPFARMATGSVWRTADIRQWARSHGAEPQTAGLAGQASR